jgi:thiamine kinase-like enzyme
MPQHFRGPALIFWPFHVMRDYTARLTEEGSRMAPELPRLARAAEALERAVGRIDLVFGHNDLLAANLLDDGDRLWLIDWEYGAYTSPLFDLGNLASNNELARADERWLLEAYYDAPLTDDLWRRYAAMKCASLLREAMWSMVAELHSPLDFDYAGYTDDYLQRFDTAFAAFDKDLGLA